MSVVDLAIVAIVFVDSSVVRIGSVFVGRSRLAAGSSVFTPRCLNSRRSHVSVLALSVHTLGGSGAGGEVVGRSIHWLPVLNTFGTCWMPTEAV